MPVEIERKFLVVGDGWRANAGPPQRFCQGYLARTHRGQVRVRRTAEQAFVTIKGRRKGPERAEYEYRVPVEDAEEMLKSLCLRPIFEKTRHDVPYNGFVWEVDIVHSAGDLVIAEIELDDAEQPITLPDWVGEEVTNDPRYSNAALATRSAPESELAATERRQAMAHSGRSESGPPA